MTGGAQFGVCHAVGAVLPIDAQATLGLALERPGNADAFTEADRQRLNAVLPHLQRVVQLRRRLGYLEAQAQTGFAALDALALGIVIATADGAVVFANAAAEALARRDEELWLGGRLGGLVHLHSSACAIPGSAAILAAGATVSAQGRQALSRAGGTPALPGKGVCTRCLEAVH